MHVTSFIKEISCKKRLGLYALQLSILYMIILKTKEWNVMLNLRKLMFGIIGVVPDKLWLSIMYRRKMGAKLNLDNPKTFNEKLQWLKLYDRRLKHVEMVDKHAVKQKVATVIGNEYIIPTLGVWRNAEQIDYESLPTKFVLKCTHDSGGVYICKNKSCMNKNEANKKMNHFLKKSYYNLYREWPYKMVTPMIIAEQYMEDSDSHELNDYKFFCFNGKVKFFKIDFNRFTNHRANYFNREGKLLPFGEENYPPDPNKKLKMPDALDEMITLAEKLSVEEIFVRVDFYYCNKKIYFGEMTYYPQAGFGKFIPVEWDEKIGLELELPFFGYKCNRPLSL